MRVGLGRVIAFTMMLALGGCSDGGLTIGSYSIGIASGHETTSFNGERAYSDLEGIVALGTRVSGSKTFRDMQGQIRGVLGEAGLEIREQDFDANTPLGMKPMKNIIGIVKGSKDGVIVIGNHCDTKYFQDFPFVGANDGGSTTAWMMEMARALGPTREGYSVWLCWFDGEEAFENWSAVDGLYGSREFVKELKETGEIDSIKVMINVDMIGDCDLGIQREQGAPAWLTSIIWSKAKELGVGKHFLPHTISIEDDHIPFRRAGIPSIDLIDFRYGSGPGAHDRNWHTANDTLERVCAESLQTVGDVVYHVLDDIEAAIESGEGR